MTPLQLRQLSVKLHKAAELQEAAEQQAGPAGSQAAFPVGAVLAAVPWSLIWKFIDQAVTAYLHQHTGQPTAPADPQSG